MLKQRRSRRRPRTHVSLGEDSEADASPASRDIFPVSRRYRSEPISYEALANQEFKDNLEEDSVLRKMNRTEIKRRTSLQGESYYSVRGSRIQSWSSGRYEPDDGDDTDHSGRLSNHTYNPNRTPLPFRDSSYSSYEYPRAADIFEGSSDVRRDRPRSRDVKQELRELREKLKRLRFEKVLQEDAEVKAATSNETQAEAERLWRAESPEWPRAHLRGMYSFSKLPNKDTISRDITIGNEAGMDDLLACVGKRMMKNPFLKESRDETSNGGGGPEGDAMESRILLPTAELAAELAAVRGKPFLDIMSLLADD